MQAKHWQQRLLTLPPLVYLLIFFAVPTLIMLFASFRYTGEYGGLAPWYYYEQGRLSFDLTLENWQRLFETDIYLRLFFKSIVYALITTILCIALGFPLALMIARSPRRHRDLLLLLVILPFWSNFLVRIYAWMIIFSPSGALTRFAAGCVWSGTDQPDVQRHRGHRLPGLRTPAIHGAAVVRQPGKTRPGAARCSSGSGRQQLATFLEYHLAVIIAGCLRRFYPGVHPGAGYVRHS